jgi:hypothetical protein
MAAPKLTNIEIGKISPGPIISDFWLHNSALAQIV